MTNNKELTESLITFLTIARTFNCKNHLVCDDNNTPLEIETVAKKLNMEVKELLNLLQILEEEELISFSETKGIIILDFRINNILQYLLTNDVEYCRTKDTRIGSEKLNFAFALLVRTIYGFSFKEDGTIVNLNNEPVCLTRIAEKIRINNLNIVSRSFRKLVNLGLIDLKWTDIKTSKKVILSAELVNEFKCFKNQLISEKTY